MILNRNGLNIQGIPAVTNTVKTNKAIVTSQTVVPSETRKPTSSLFFSIVPVLPGTGFGVKVACTHQIPPL